MTGVTTVSAHTTLSVGGVSLTRAHERHGCQLGSGDEDVGEREDLDRAGRDEPGRPSRTRSRSTLQKDIGDGNGFVAAAGEAMTTSR